MDNADKSIGTISVWDETYEGWLLSSEGCKPGATGYILEQNIRGTNIRGQSRWNMKKVKDHPKWPWSVFEMTYKKRRRRNGRL